MLARFAQRTRSFFPSSKRGYLPLVNFYDEQYRARSRSPWRLFAWALFTITLLVLPIWFYLEIFPFDTLAFGCSLRQSLANVPLEETNSSRPLIHTRPARQISPAELMARAPSPYGPARIIHQSWKDQNLPDRFKAWSNNWRAMNGEEWEYVLWTDEDNLELVKTRFPEWLDTYQSLPKNIFRVDMVRNFYMYAFGGVYADLDLEPLKPIENCLSFPNSSAPFAAIGQMGPLSFPHSTPNAFFFASGPGHPFFMRPLQILGQLQKDVPNAGPEAVTGPLALRQAWLQWSAEDDASPANASRPHVELLDQGRIYPFDWKAADMATKCTCHATASTFSAGRCKALFPNAWTITYWTQSWKGA